MRQIVCFCVVALLVAACSREVSESSKATSSEVAAAEEQATKQNTPEAYLNLSLAYYNAREYQRSIDSANTALKMKAEYAEAFNNIAASQIMLANYDAAIAAANEAVRINPQVELYRNNLAWAHKEKAGKLGK